MALGDAHVEETLRESRLEVSQLRSCRHSRGEADDALVDARQLLRDERGGVAPGGSLRRFCEAASRSARGAT